MERKFIENAIKSISTGRAQNLVFLPVEDERLDGPIITIGGKEMLNFGSCSYLGLEQDQRLRQGAIDAITRYGTQYSSSRIYTSLGLYRDLEELLSEMYGYPTLVTPTTSLGHISAVPALVEPDDLIILDHQVHTSVRNACQLSKAQAIPVELIRHDNMDRLAKRLEQVADTYSKVWYFCDGVYSIFGDGLDHQGLQSLLTRYDNLHVYVDDAHGNSWVGKNGCGYALSKMPYHDRMIVITSLNKSFAAGGGALICHDDLFKQKILECGSTMIFSGPLQPPLLGAAVASAKIHLSDEIDQLQADLMGKIQHFAKTAADHGLPIVNQDLTPIFFLGVGDYDAGLDLCGRMIARGFYCNISSFPSVPRSNTGLRCTITRHLKYQDIEDMLSVLAETFSRVLNDHNLTLTDIHRAFKMDVQPQ